MLRPQSGRLTSSHRRLLRIEWPESLRRAVHTHQAGRHGARGPSLRAKLHRLKFGEFAPNSIAFNAHEPAGQLLEQCGFNLLGRVHPSITRGILPCGANLRADCCRSCSSPKSIRRCWRTALCFSVSDPANFISTPFRPFALIQPHVTAAGRTRFEIPFPPWIGNPAGNLSYYRRVACRTRRRTSWRLASHAGTREVDGLPAARFWVTTSFGKLF